MTQERFVPGQAYEILGDTYWYVGIDPTSPTAHVFACGDYIYESWEKSLPQAVRQPSSDLPLHANPAPQVLPEDRQRAFAEVDKFRSAIGSGTLDEVKTQGFHGALSYDALQTIRSCLSCVDDYTLPDDDAWINMIFGCAPDYAGVLLLPSERSPSGFGNDRHVLADIGKLYLERLNRQRESAIKQITVTEVK
jgi:hypothetical protein